MELYIRLQVQTIGAALAVGCGAAVVYDLLRAVRLARRRRAVTHITDLLFVLAVGWVLLRFALSIGRGELRLYVLPCAALGAWAYLRLLAPILRPVWRFWVGAAAQMGRMLSRPAKIFWLFCKKVWKSAQKAIAFLKKNSKIKIYRKKDAPAQDEEENR